MERNELSEDRGFHELLLKHQILACSYLKVGRYQPQGGERENNI